MFLHHLKIAVRNFFKYKVYSFINLIGLTIGITCVLFIFLFVNDELSYDKYHENAHNIYRVAGRGHLNGSDFNFATCGSPTAQALIADYPEVLDAIRFRNRGSFLVSIDDQTFKEERVIYADSNLFNFFSFDLLNGDPKTVLTAPNSVIITPELAQKYFGDEDPIGQILKLDNRADYKVTGVFAPIPTNTHFHFDMFLSMSTLEESRRPEWTSFNFQTYIRIKEGSDADALEDKFSEMVVKYIGPELEKYLGATLEQFAEQGNNIGFYLQPLTDIHLHSDLEDELEANSDIAYVYLFSIIGFFILLIACINFMNLATARSANRAREVGIKKVVGALRSQLVGQFMMEFIVLSVVAIILALGLSHIILPSFNNLAGKELAFSVFRDGSFLLMLLAVAVGVGLLAGSYPAFYLSAFKPIAVLKGKLQSGAKGGWIRSTLVVVQFATSIFLIIGTLVVMSQLRYVQNKKLGFNKDQVLILNDAYALGDQVNTFKEEMLQNPQVKSATVTGFLPVRSYRNSSSYWSGLSPDVDNSQVINNWQVDYDYVKTMGMEVIKGRDFSKDFGTDSTAVLVNETLVRRFGWEDPLGQHLSNYGGMNNEVVSYHVIGVVKDFHFNSLRQQIGPLMMYLGRSRGFISFRIQTDEVKSLTNQLEEKWDEYAAGQPFSYSFMDERFDRMYDAERRFGTIFGVFAGLAIVVACLGLFGLAAFTAEQRTKEIGIRKVLGATYWQIIGLLSKEFAMLISIGFVIGSLIAWFGMNYWLQNFEYKTAIGGWIFAIAAFTIFLVAALTVSYQSTKAARANPVDSLKYE